MHPVQTAPDLNNTEIAFRHKSDNDLKKARLLFSLFNYPWLVTQGPGLAKFSLSIGLPVKGLIKNTIFSQFCGGENIEECSRTTAQLAQYGVGTILDYSVEGEEKEVVFDATCEEILKTIEKAKGNKNIPYSVFKVTGIGRFGLLEKLNAQQSLSPEESEEWERVKARFGKLCLQAYEMKVRLLVDAEETWIQDVIDQLTEEMMERFNTTEAYIFNTVQLYRHDRLSYLKQLFLKAEKKGYKVGVKLVRGAYMEKERARAQEKGYTSPIQPDKASADRDYDEALRFCVEHIAHFALCAGTHNEQSSLLLAQLMGEKGLANDDPRIYFSQLLGMSDNLSFNLAAAGYNVAKYVPYGPVKAVLPYLSRRAQENSSVAGQAGRELTLIMKELQRRRLG